MVSVIEVTEWHLFRYSECFTTKTSAITRHFLGMVSGYGGCISLCVYEPSSFRFLL